MNPIIKVTKTLRNNWKKSVFAALAITYGYNYTLTYLRKQELMREYCLKAAEFGRKPISNDVNPKNITVILNPNANKRKATEEFEKYCAPILNLGGVFVNVVKTEFEGHAKQLIEKVNNTDAIIVAGGDGTLCEVVTGILRRTEEKTDGLVPLGVLPLGKSNTLGSVLFPNKNELQKVRSLAEASLAVLEESTKPIDVMKIEITEGEENDNRKPIYALSSIKWGAYRDAEIRKDNYWFVGPLRKYATYLFNGFKNNLTWKCEADIKLSPPCDGCSNCVTVEKQKSTKWYQRYSKTIVPRYLGITNPECSKTEEKKVSTVDFTVLSSNVIPDNNTGSELNLMLGPESIEYTQFVLEGWKQERGGSREFSEKLKARQIDINPKQESSQISESWFSIDNDHFVVKPIRVTILPNIIKVFCKKDNIIQ